MHADQVVEMATSLLMPTATATAIPKPIPTIIRMCPTLQPVTRFDPGIN